MRALRLAWAMCVVAGLCLGASCKDDADDEPAGSVSTHAGKDGGGGNGGRDGGGSDRDGGTSASGGRGGGGSGSGSNGKDGGGGSGGSGGTVDAGNPDKCAGVSCPAPSVCDRALTPPSCVCPLGYHFSDLGDEESPCQPDCNADCDGG